MRNQQRRRRALVGLVFLLAGAILLECWQATSAAAAAGGRPMPWLWPVTLEGFLVVLILVYWDARSERRKAPLARLLLAAVTLVAAGVQALAAPATWLGWVTAAVTPVILTGAVEFAVWLFYGGDLAATGSTSREVSAPRPSGPDAGSVAGKAGSSQPSRLAPATPPLSPAPAAEPVASQPSAEVGSLHGEPRPVTAPATDRDAAVIRRPYQPREEAILYRQRGKPDGYAAMITKHGFVPEEAWALARERGWPVANGHREAVLA